MVTSGAVCCWQAPWPQAGGLHQEACWIGFKKIMVFRLPQCYQQVGPAPGDVQLCFHWLFLIATVNLLPVMRTHETQAPARQLDC